MDGLLANIPKTFGQVWGIKPLVCVLSLQYLVCAFTFMLLKAHWVWSLISFGKRSRMNPRMALLLLLLLDTKVWPEFGVTIFIFDSNTLPSFLFSLISFRKNTSSNQYLILVRASILKFDAIKFECYISIEEGAECLTCLFLSWDLIHLKAHLFILSLCFK